MTDEEFYKSIKDLVYRKVSNDSAYTNQKTPKEEADEWHSFVIDVTVLTSYITTDGCKIYKFPVGLFGSSGGKKEGAT